MGFSRAVREGECKCLGTFQIFAYVMLVVTPLVRQVSRPAEIPRGEEDSSLCGRGSQVILQWHEYKGGPVAISALCHRYSEDCPSLGSTDIVSILKFF